MKQIAYSARGRLSLRILLYGISALPQKNKIAKHYVAGARDIKAQARAQRTRFEQYSNWTSRLWDTNRMNFRNLLFRARNIKKTKRPISINNYGEP